ncbi:3-hydroxyisobutyrate dehydrogenase [Cohaesibacter marisflavi]|uniref:3-hydroxyisobutyrate dehydrogenase n=1 Tax=Cohaesibacter marisflavi TaxID=655353 RepID=A0A1I4ZCC1_9HYPH|nr:NAD(P)-dependent oxidoreductase [Cohaesibacter marisflavi]SFN47673.1 3-hydroxyisobutyrate dehydrogenase [Cohaesibacter marisflavi]
MPQMEKIGFIGLGTMGTPMALKLLEAGTPLMVWNRTLARSRPLSDAGASVAHDVQEMFAQCQTVLLMLADEAAIDAVLSRNTAHFASLVAGKTVVSLGTVPADYSALLSRDVCDAGGRYVEAPVSGSRKPAEQGQLVGLLAGMSQDLKTARALLTPCCKDIFECGEVPRALNMKIAVNSYLITLVTGLVEAWNLAEQNKLDMALFTDILNAGPMASEVSKVKLAKLLTGDFSRQAGIADVFKNCRLVVENAKEFEAPSPLMDICLKLYQETNHMELEEDDMIAVLGAIKRQTQS